MIVNKIIVAQLFESRIEGSIKLITHIFIGFMEMYGVFIYQIIRRQISSTTKPTVYNFTFLIV